MDFTRRMNLKYMLELLVMGYIFCICQLVMCEDKSIPKGVKRSFDFPTIFYPGPDNKFITSAPLPRLPKNLKVLLKHAGTSLAKPSSPEIPVKMSEKGEFEDIPSDAPPSPRPDVEPFPSPRPDVEPFPSPRPDVEPFPSPRTGIERFPLPHQWISKLNNRKLPPPDRFLQNPKQHLHSPMKHIDNSNIKFTPHKIPHFLNRLPPLVTVPFKHGQTNATSVKENDNHNDDDVNDYDHGKDSQEHDNVEESNVESEDDKEIHSTENKNFRHKSQSNHFHNINSNSKSESMFHPASSSLRLADGHRGNQQDQNLRHEGHSHLKYIHLEKPLSITIPLPAVSGNHPSSHFKAPAQPAHQILSTKPNQIPSTEKPGKLPPFQGPFSLKHSPQSLRLHISPFSTLPHFESRRPASTNYHSNQAPVQTVHRYLVPISDFKKPEHNQQLYGGQPEKPGKSTAHQFYNDHQPHQESLIPIRGHLTSVDKNSNIKSSNTEGKQTVEPTRQTTFSCQDKSGYFADIEASCRVFHICHQNRKFTFSCPEGTLFHQKFLICDWDYKVKCTS